MTPQIKRRSFLESGLAVMAGAAFTGCKTSNVKRREPVRIGWQVPLALQGQIVQVLKRGVFADDALPLTFIPFTYGGPQMEAALGQQLDVVLVGDQPLVNLLSRTDTWAIVSRLFYTRTALLVPSDSTVKQLSDLRAAKVATPFGSVAHREAILWQEQAGLDPRRDVNNLNLDILEISNLVQTGATRRWDGVGAVGVWEPTTSLLGDGKLARVLAERRTLGLVGMSRAFMSDNDAPKLLAQILRAWAYFAAHRNEVDTWYLQDAKLSYSTTLLQSAAEVDPTIRVDSAKAVDLRLSADHLGELERAADWALRYGFIKQRPDLRRCVDTQILARAYEQL